MNPTAEWADKLFPKGGWFVEAGAHDGIGDSQTYELERTGRWTGLCVEPSRAYHGLKMNRDCKISRAVLDERDGDEVQFMELSGGAVELSGIVKYFGDHWNREQRTHKIDRILTKSLTTLLAEKGSPPVIELLCLDTEGSELAILRGHDFERFRFLAIQVEHNGVESRQRDLAELLIYKGYLGDGTDGINDRYTYNWKA